MTTTARTKGFYPHIAQAVVTCLTALYAFVSLVLLGAT